MGGGWARASLCLQHRPHSRSGKLEQGAQGGGREAWVTWAKLRGDEVGACKGQVRELGSEEGEEADLLGNLLMYCGETEA